MAAFIPVVLWKRVAEVEVYAVSFPIFEPLRQIACELRYEGNVFQVILVNILSEILENMLFFEALQKTVLRSASTGT